MRKISLAAVAALLCGSALAAPAIYNPVDTRTIHPSLRQAGCSSATADCKPILDALFTSAAALGAQTVYTDGLHFKYLSGSLEIPANMTLDCGGNGQYVGGTTVWGSQPSTIEFNYGTAASPTGYTVISDARAAMVGCLVINQNMVSLSAASTHRQMLDAKKNFAGTGWTCNGTGCGIRRSMILGVTICADDSNFASPDIENDWCNGTNGLHLDNVHDVPMLHDFLNSGFLFKNLANAKATWTVSALADNGGGLCKVTTSTANDLITGDEVNIKGTLTGCDGYWPAITVIDTTHFTLDGSAFGGVSTTATGDNGSTVLTLATIANVENGMTITGTGIPASTTVSALSNPDTGGKMIKISAATTAALSATAVTLGNPVYAAGGTVYSYAVTYNGYGFSFTNSEGIVCKVCFDFGHRTGFIFGAGSSWSRCIGCGKDFWQEFADPGVKGVYFTGAVSKGNAFVDSVVHSAAQSVVSDASLDAANTVANSILGDSDSSGGVFDIESGRVILDGNKTTVVGTSFFGSGVTNAALLGNLMPSQTVLPQNAAAVLPVVCSGDVFASGSLCPSTPANGTRMTFVSGNYYAMPVVTLSTLAIAANTLYLEPFFTPVATTFSKQSIYVSVTAGTNCELGLYKDNNGVPGALILDTGTVSSASSASRELTGKTIPIPAGWSWAAVGCDNTPTLESTTAANGMMHNVAGMNTQIIAGGVYTVAWTFSAGNLPASASAASLAAGAVPVVYFRL